MLGFGYLQLTDANTLIEQQDRELQEQRDLIDKKETFSAAMQSLQSKAAEFDGVLLAADRPGRRVRDPRLQGVGAPLERRRSWTATSPRPHAAEQA